jgi:CheY-like chemotaxis protein
MYNDSSNLNLDSISKLTSVYGSTSELISNGTLFLVEDSPTQAAQFELYFENLGYQVTTAFNASSAFKQLQSLQMTAEFPNLIILDLILPGESGIELCYRIRSELEEFAGIPILLFSEAQQALQNTLVAYQAGADYYVMKKGDGLGRLATVIKALTHSRTLSA